IRDRVSSTPSRLSYSRLKPDQFPISRNWIAESRPALALLRPSRHTVTPDSSSSDSIWNSKNSNFTIESNFSEHQEAGSMENNDRTLKELATLDMVYQSWCIQCPPLEPAQSLMMMDQSMIDAASGGALMDKTPTAAPYLISNMANNMQ
ncbi:hypothetical protein CR513_52387, partial [Mucuna pruriens]